jgi:fructan beta-fructosidase
MPTTPTVPRFQLARVAAIAATMMIHGAAHADQPDTLVADFEGKDYGAWTSEGDAFGSGPARGTLPGQMSVTGYLGKGLVNSFYGGDGSTGKLTSPEFAINRRYLAFLIGGGSHPNKACMNLRVDGKIVRTATGPNDKPGGDERLDPAFWEVRDLMGKRARIEIVDQATGGWGHINVDHIVLTDARPAQPQSNPRRELTIDARYLCLPVKHFGTKRKISVLVAGKVVRDCDVEAADLQPDAFAYLDVREIRGRVATVVVDRLAADSKFLSGIRQAADREQPANLYDEVYRPQFHFSTATGWLNDPNGLVYYDGEYHLFFQHNPYGVTWGNMTWGHAVSPDLVHWKELDDAIHPDRLGTIFSGSAVVDRNNTTGFQTGEHKPIVCIYTSAGGTSQSSQGQPFAQSIAYSNDRGRTWKKYDKNPVLPNVVGSNRDPKVVWHEPSRRWIMVLFLDKNDFGFFASADLKSWERLQTITVPGCGECPDFFEIAIDGEARKKWVFTAANDQYLVGDFDGRRFTPDAPTPRPGNWGKNYYAVQTYSDIPASDSRRIQIAWMKGGQYPGMPFNQQMSFPGELRLRRFPAGLRLCRTPIKEIELLHARQHRWTDLTLREGENPLQDIQGDLFDIRVELESAGATDLAFRIRGESLTWSAKDRKLSWQDSSAPLVTADGRLKLQILVDRTSFEVFANDGLVAMTGCFVPPSTDKTLRLHSSGGAAKIRSLEVFELRSAWRK